MSIRDHKIVTFDVVIIHTDGTKTYESYTGLFPTEEHGRVWLKRFLRTKVFEVVATRIQIPAACIIEHNW